ncbi:MAG: dihydroorotate dehydrogenase electron transfer subunit [Coriobacteriia bacterium]|nr:dihydroorotate dehydrogenase electron transfer subunit [Coriobacteriia bacterium]
MCQSSPAISRAQDRDRGGPVSRPKPFVETVEVISNREICPGVHSIVLVAPRIAKTILPGQFIHLDIDKDALTLRRPLSVYKTDGEKIEILYQIVGVGTDMLSKMTTSDTMSAVGPLGRDWPVKAEAKRALLVAGGLGAAPLGMLTEKLRAQGTQIYFAQGSTTEDRLIARDAFAVEVDEHAIATDDGSCGVCGFVTAPVKTFIDDILFDIAYVCGPEPMQRGVVDLLKTKHIETYVSLERLMACGIGACLSCVVPTINGLKRACVDGPVFNAEEVLWNEAVESRVH